MSFDPLQFMQPVPSSDELQPADAFLSDTEFNEILSSMGPGLLCPSDSISFDFDSLFPQSKDASTQTTGPTWDDNETFFHHQHGLSDSSLDQEKSEKSEGKRRSFHLAEVKFLKEWLNSHPDHPYPTKQEKSSLAEKTGLSVIQVSTWFANARRRKKQVCNTSITSKSLDSLNGNRQTRPVQWDSLSPLDRWRNSPPETEAAPLRAIINAVAGSESNDLSNESGRLSTSAPEYPQQNLPLPTSDAKSLVSSEASGSALSSSSGLSAFSFDSRDSHGSFGRFYLNDTPRRRRRRTKAVSILSRPQSKTSRKRPYQCTFCTDAFRTKYDWTRHEKTLHLSLEKFTCTPLGATYNDPLNGIDRCAFCDEPHPSDDHVESHRFGICQQKPIVFRTFYRKDHLLQHLRLVHGINQSVPLIETWKSQTTHVKSRCGFCGETFTVWSERNNHIARHFREGALMKDWRGCRGLEPSVALAVENAMPPYLIGIESTAMEPFSASRLVGGDAGAVCPGETTNQLPKAKPEPTPFEHLTARLSEFAWKSQTAGSIITDEMLQKEARLIAYGDDDPWNQTPADNPEWLKLFKEGMEILSDSNASRHDFSDNHSNENYNFYLPWSADRWTPCDPSISSAAQNSTDMINSCMAWSWLSPECLAEFRWQKMITCSTGPPGNPADGDTEQCQKTDHLTQNSDVGGG